LGDRLLFSSLSSDSHQGHQSDEETDESFHVI
jgi:hypothetical protein